jgi:hypothetical protein
MDDIPNLKRTINISYMDKPSGSVYLSDILWVLESISDQNTVFELRIYDKETFGYFKEALQKYEEDQKSQYSSAVNKSLAK